MKFLKILAPVSGEKQDTEVIELACKLAKESKGKVNVVYAIQVKRSLPLDAELEPEVRKAEEILNHAEGIAEGDDYKVETDLLQTREVGAAIVDEAIEQGADLIVLGVRHRRHFGEFNLGEVIPYVLKNAPCNVIVLFLGQSSP